MARVNGKYFLFLASMRVKLKWMIFYQDSKEDLNEVMSNYNTFETYRTDPAATCS
jgi:hypothetical protein